MKKILASFLVLALLLGLMAAVAADEPEIVGGVLLGAPRASGQVMDTLAPSDPFVEGLNENESWTGAGATYSADWFALQFVPTQDYTFTGAELVLGGIAGEVVFRLYDDAGGLPGSILSEGTFFQDDNYTWHGTDLAPGVPVTTGTTYWFGFRPVNSTYLSAADTGTLVTHSWDYGGDGWEGASTSFYWMAKFFGVPTGGNPTMHVGAIDGYFFGDKLLMRVLVVDEYDAPLGPVYVEATITLPSDEWARWRFTKYTGWARFWAPAMQAGNYQICVDDLVLGGYDYAPGDNVLTCNDWDY